MNVCMNVCMYVCMYVRRWMDPTLHTLPSCLPTLSTLPTLPTLSTYPTCLYLYYTILHYTTLYMYYMPRRTHLGLFFSLFSLELFFCAVLDALGMYMPIAKHIH